MSRVLASIAALALTAALALPGAANAANRADGVRPHDARQMTDVSSQRIHRRVVHRGVVRRGVVVRRGYLGPGAGYWGPRYAYPIYRRPFVGPYAGGYPYYRPWRPWYAAYPYYGGYSYYGGHSYYGGYSYFGPHWGLGW
jgi:hypothetical protein